MATVTTTEIQQIYIGYLGRAADKAGLDYWVEQITSDALTLEQLRANITNEQQEYTDGYGKLSRSELVDQVYQTLFERAPDDAGKEYWVSGDGKDVNADQLIKAFLDGASTDDQTILNNKTEVAEYYTAAAGTNYDKTAATTTIGDVTADPATVTTAKGTVDTTLKTDITYTLTADMTSVTEGNAVTFTVTATDDLSTDSTFNYQIGGVAVAGGTADPAADLGKVTGEVTIPAGQKTATFTVTPVDDGTTEGFEGFNVTLLDNSFATKATSGNVAIKDGAAAGQTFTLTTTTDNVQGTSGNDTLNGVLQAAGDTGTTVAPGDSFDGGDGVDTMNISVAGSLAGSYTLSAISTQNVEKVLVSNFDAGANDAHDHSVDAALMTGLTTVGLSASSTTGDTSFDNLKNLVAAEMRNGAADLTVAYEDSVVTGTADAQTLTVSNNTAGTFTADKTENLTVNSELAKSTLDAVASDALKTLTVTGDQDLTITNNVAFAATANGTDIDGTVDASAFTGKLNVTTSGAQTVKVTGGTGDDTINMAGNLTTNDVIDGGAGTDTLTLDAAALTTEFTNVSNVEKVAFNDTNAAVAMDVSKLSSGVTEVIVDTSDNANANATQDSTISNLNGQSVTIKHTTADAQTAANDGVKYTITNATDTADDAVSVKLDAIDTAANNKGVDTLDVSNYETVNLASAKSTSVTANTVDVLTAASGKSVVVTGDADLTIDSITGGAMTSFDASALDGKLTATFATGADKVTATAATKDTTFNFGTGLNNDDTVVGGAGTKDKVTATVTGATATTGALNISNVETVELNTTGANTLNLTGVTGASTVAVTNNKQTITGLDLNTAIQLGTTAIQADTNSEIDVTAADATGSSDTLKVVLENTANHTNSIIDASNIEALDLTVNHASNNATLDLTTFEGASVSIASKSGVTGSGTLALGTLHKDTTAVTSTYAGAVTTSFANATQAVSFTGAGSAVQTVTGSGQNDTFTIGETGAITHVIAGGAGTDTLNIDVKNGFVNAGSISAVEKVNVNVKAGDDVAITTDFVAAVTDVTVTGGNSLSTFDIGTVDAAAKTVDASAFGGNLLAEFGANNLDDTVTVTGGALTTDEITAQYTADATYSVKTTGVEILDLDVDGDVTVNLSGTTGVTTVEVDVATTKTATIDKVTDQLIRVTDVAGTGVVEAKLADASGSTDTVSFELKSTTNAASIADTAQLKTTDIETVNLKASTRAETLSLANLSMTTNGQVMSLNVTGDQALTVSALNADVTTVDASGMATGGSFIQTGRSATDASTYTGSAGDDTFIMMNKDDAINGGEGADTLDVNFTSVIGGMAIDLNATGDQITTFNGAANAAVQTGFQHVDLSGYTGNGAEITANAKGSTITGTAAADSITLGAGADTVNFTTGASQDTISGFTVNSDKLGFAGIAGIDGTTADAVDVAANAASTDLTDGKIIVFADGADGAAATAITNYTDMTNVATFLAGNLDETNGESYVAVVNDLAGDDVYAYLVSNVAGGSIDSAEVSLIGVMNDIGSTALDKADLA